LVKKYKVTYEDLPYQRKDGTVTYYNLTMAGDDMSSPTTIVLHRSKLAPEQSMAELDRPVIMGLSKALEQKPDRIGIYSERDHERYDWVRMQQQYIDLATGEPQYAPMRDHGTLFEKEYVDKDVNKYEEQAKLREERAEQKRLYEKAVSQDKEFKEATIQSSMSRLKADFLQKEIERDEKELD